MKEGGDPPCSGGLEGSPTEQGTEKKHGPRPKGRPRDGDADGERDGEAAGDAEGEAAGDREGEAEASMEGDAEGDGAGEGEGDAVTLGKKISMGMGGGDGAGPSSAGGENHHKACMLKQWKGDRPCHTSCQKAWHRGLEFR